MKINILLLFVVFLICPTSSFADFKPDTSTLMLYEEHESKCLSKGWQKKVVTVDGLKRQILWKGPKGPWKKGAIILLHGGGGTYSNYCSNIPLGQPMVKFSELALRRGFALFSLDSTFGLGQDEQGNSCGKRWESMVLPNKTSVDLPFIQHVIEHVVPDARPQKSSRSIFMAGISNGGFMTTLAATQFSDQLTAFAAVASGDPYGSYMDCRQDLVSQRKMAHGTFNDKETRQLISEETACNENYYDINAVLDLNSTRTIPFKQFHHEGDALVHLSCMKKAKALLVKSGFKDDGSFILPAQKKSFLAHFWALRYNRPLLRFFEKNIQ